MQDQDDGNGTEIEIETDDAPDEQAAALDGATAEQLRAEIERLRGLLAEAEDKHLRAVAEMQNFRRRSARDQAQRMQYANQELLSQTIPVMDNLQRALAHEAHVGGEDFARGVEMVVQQFHEMLTSFGVEPVLAEGEAFDPHVHEAVAQVETDEVAEGTVLQVETPGYCLHDRCLRPAKVVVAKAPG